MRTLGITGTYTLIVAGQVYDLPGITPNYTFNVDPRGNVPVTPPTGTALTLGQTINDAINAFGETDTYVFSLLEESFLYFDTLTTNVQFQWALSGPSGPTVDRFFTLSDGYSGPTNPIIHLYPGSYALTVSAGTQTGNYSFRLVDIETAASALTPGTAVSDVLNPANETDFYHFTAQSGDRIFLNRQTLGGGSGNTYWRLIGPSGQLLHSGFVNDVDPITIVETGRHTLLLEGAYFATGPESYTVNVQPVVDDTEALALNATTAGNISQAGQQDRFTFALNASTSLYFDSLTSNSSFTWSIIGQSGTAFGPRGFTNADGYTGPIDPVLNLPTGSYILIVDGLGDATGSYSFRLMDLASATPLTTGVPTGGALNPANESDLYSFSGQAGDRIFLDRQATTGGNGNTYWRLIGPAGQNLHAGFLGDVDPLTLPQTGTYTLILEGAYFDTSNLTYTVNVQLVTNDSAPLALNTTTTGSIGHAGQQDHYTFTLAGSTFLYFDSLTNNSQLTWSILGPNGPVVTSRSFSNSDGTSGPAPLSLQAGSYTLIVDAPGDVTGSYGFRLVELASATALTPGASLSGTLSPANETDLYSFMGQAGDRVSLVLQTATGGNGSAFWRLIGPSGQSIHAGTLTDVDPLNLPQAGSYTLLIEGPVFFTTPLDYTVNVQPVQDDAGSLSINATISGNIDHAGQRDLYSFTLAAARRVLFDSLTNNVNITWSLSGPQGVLVTNRSFSASDAGSISNPLVSLAAGNYTLAVDGVGDTTGGYSFRLVDVELAEGITLGTPISGSLNPANESDIYRFSATSGSRLYLDIQAYAGSGSSDSRFWRLLDPSGISVANGTFGLSFGALFGDVELQPLALTGVYTLLVEGSVGMTASATYTFNLQPYALQPLTIGTAVTGVVNQAGQYTFSLQNAARLVFDGLNSIPSNNFNWTLVGQETIVNNRAFVQSDDGDFLANPLLNLPAGGYSLFVDGSADTANVPFVFRLLDLSSATAMTPGTPVSGTLTPANETDLYNFVAEGGGRLFIDLQALGAGASPSWRLFDPFGNQLFNATMQDVETFTLPETGVYTLAIEGRRTETTPVPYTFNVQPVADSAQAMALNTRVTGAISVPGEQDHYTFNGNIGQQLYFDAISLNGSNTSVRLTAPGGTIILNATGMNQNVVPFRLDQTGAYTLTVDGVGDRTGSYVFRLADLATARPLNRSVEKIGRFDPASETDLYYFDGVAGEHILVEQTAVPMVGGNWRLIAPTSQSLATGSMTSNLSFALPMNGRYVLAAEGTGTVSDPAADYRFRLTSQINAPVPASGLGTVLSGVIAAGQTVTHNFTASAGTLVYFESQDHDGDAIVVETLTPAGLLLHTHGAGVDFGPETLPESGTYTLTIRGSLPTSTGDYRIRVVDIAAEASPVSIGQVVSGILPLGGDTKIYQFTGSPGQRLYYDGLDSTDLDVVTARLILPTGLNLFTVTDRLNAGPSTIRGSLPLYLLIESQQLAAADFSFQLLDLNTASVITPNTTINGTLSTGFETDLYSMTGAAGQRAYFDGLSTHGFSDGSWALFNQFNQQIAGASSSLVQSDFEAVLPATGTYTLAVTGARSTTSATSYSFRVTTTNDVTIDTFTPIGDGRSTGNGTVFTYDPAFSQLTSITDELGRQTLFAVDPANGNTRSITQVVGTVGGDDDVITQFTYTSQGLIDLVTDALGRVTDYDYDLRGRLVQVTYAKNTADQGVQQFEYDAAGNVVAFLDERNNRTEFAYDAMNRLTLTRDPLLHQTAFAYDAAGNLIRTTDARTNQSTYAYDVFDRRIGMTDANSGITKYAYDVDNNLISVTDPLNHQTTYEYDLRDRLVKTVDAGGSITRFGYDPNNNLTSLTDPVGNTTFFAYDPRDRMVTETDPLGRATRYQYDSVDNLIGTIDRNGQGITYAYDDLDRLITETWIGGGNLITSQYDKVGNLTSILDQFSKLTFTYDNRDRVKSVDNEGTPNAPRVKLGYVYDGAGNLLAVNDAINGTAAGVTSYQYDAANRMTRITQTGNGVTDKRVDMTYNEVNQFASVSRYSDLAAGQTVAVTNYVHDALNRITNMTHKNAANTVLNHFDLQYDAASRITKITDIDGASDYSYDVKGQLTGADHSAAAKPDETYDYDDNGNRISSSLHGDGYVIGPGNRLLSDGTFQYLYDGKGSMIRRTEIATGKVREFTWDQRGRLVEVDDRNGVEEAATQIVKFTYDALNRRIGKSFDADGIGSQETKVTIFVADRDDVLLEFVDGDAAGANAQLTLRDRYLHGPAVDQILAQEDAAGNVFWILADHINTVRSLINKDGLVIDRINYDSFGNITGADVVETSYHFAGREFDEEIDAYFNRNRYYSSSLGRFLSEDPIRFGGGDLNLLRYVKNSPIMLVDPTGLVCGSGWNDPIVPDYWFGRDLRPACEIHDACYSNPARTKNQCDQELRDNINKAGGPGNWYYRGVDWFGQGAYDQAQQEARRRAQEQVSPPGAGSCLDSQI